MSEAQPPAESSLGAGCEFQGIVVLRGPGRIDGVLEGQIVGSDVVWIGAGAQVAARVDAAEVVVEGRVEGDLTARRRIELRSSAHVVGSLSAPRVQAAEGCFFEGRWTTAASDPASPPAQPSDGPPSGDGDAPAARPGAADPGASSP